MTTITQKKKLSKSAWFLIFLLIGSVVAISVLAVIGYISLQFIADGIIGYMTVGASSWIMGTLLIILPFVGGILFAYFIKTYFVGNKTASNIGQGGYSPAPVYPSGTAQKDTETVIS